MLYCFGQKNYNGNYKNMEDIMKEAIKLQSFIYYDKELDCFKNEDDKIIDIKNRKVLTHCFVIETKGILDALIRHGAIVPNSFDEVIKIENWFEYIKPKRNIITFKGIMLEDNNFLKSLLEQYGSDSELFLKTVKKDYNGIVDIKDLIDENSSLRKAFEYHKDDEFIISDKVSISEDKLGREEYRCFILDGHIMNISRVTDTIYHRVPADLIAYVDSILSNLICSFPKTFVLDVFKCNYGYDILECNSFEASGTYLYNTIFSISDDLEHNNLMDIPNEKMDNELTFDATENLTPSTLKNINGTFSKDYYDIEHYGQRINGTIFFEGLGNENKINLKDLLSSSFTPIDDELDLTKKIK